MAAATSVHRYNRMIDLFQWRHPSSRVHRLDRVDNQDMYRVDIQVELVKDWTFGISGFKDRKGPDF